MLQEMLQHIPPHIPNRASSIVPWLLVFDKWTISEIYGMIDHIITARGLPKTSPVLGSPDAWL